MHIPKLAFTIILLATAFFIGRWNVIADTTHNETSAAASGDTESIDVRLARAHLNLSKLDLRRGMELEKQIPGRLPPAMLEKLQSHVEIDEERLAQCLTSDPSESLKVNVRRAESQVRLAEADVERKRARVAVAPDAFNRLYLERAQATAELASLNLEMARSLGSNTEAIQRHLQWQIDDLGQQVRQLQLESFAGIRSWSNK